METSVRSDYVTCFWLHVTLCPSLMTLIALLVFSHYFLGPSRHDLVPRKLGNRCPSTASASPCYRPVADLASTINPSSPGVDACVLLSSRVAETVRSLGRLLSQGRTSVPPNNPFLQLTSAARPGPVQDVRWQKG